MEANRFLDNDNFSNKFSEDNFEKNRSDRYKKEKEATSVKGVGYWVFLIISFLIFYLIFAKFLFK